MTESEFISQEIRKWGFDYIERLLDQGYEPALTTKGWTWILPVSDTSLRNSQTRSYKMTHRFEAELTAY